MQTPLTALFDLDIPVIQSPMAGVSTPQMAAEVANSGALGSIALGALGAGSAEQALIDARAATTGPLVANVFCHQLPRVDPHRESAWLKALEPLFAEFDAHPPSSLNEIYLPFTTAHPGFDLVLQSQPAAISFHFGLPDQAALKAIRARNIRTLGTATSLPEARVLVDAGIDLIVAQGMEAGGHSGAFNAEDALAVPPTQNLVSTLCNAGLNTPIVAAGGLADGRDIRSALDAGAAGVQMGTVFIPTAESTADQLYRENLNTARPTERSMNLSGRVARGFRSPLFDVFAQLSLQPPDYPFTYDATKALSAAAKTAGRSDYGVMWAGTGRISHGCSTSKEVIAYLKAGLTGV
jgi:nitronate monooxygenase